MTVVIDQVTYPVVITLKKMRRIVLRFREGTFFISAPFHTSNAWIKKQLEAHGLPLIKKRNQVQPPVSQTGAFMLGKWYPLDAYRQLIKLTPPFTPLSKEANPLAESWFLKQLIIRVDVWRQRLGIIRHYRVRIRKMITRLGSNSRKTLRLTFASKLMHVAWSMIDAVIVHELIHDIHFNHSPKFYQALHEAYPAYAKEHAKLLSGQYR
jgi:predicted metal-dependent hydrolase